MLKPGRTLTADDLSDVDALMIRSVTKVNDAVVISKANKLKFVGTATAGMDHVDQALLKEKGIFFTAAPGCNKVGVAEYAFSVIDGASTTARLLGISIKPLALSVRAKWVRYLEKCLKGMGFKVLINDPPKQARGR